jgi:hypothetical protein
MSLRGILPRRSEDSPTARPRWMTIMGAFLVLLEEIDMYVETAVIMHMYISGPSE